MLILYNFPTVLCDVHISTGDDRNERYNIYNNVEAKVLFYCKVFERMVIVSYTLYMIVPAVIEVQAYQRGETTLVHPDIGLFNDL